MKKIGPVFVFVLFCIVLVSTVLADQTNSSPFIGTWGGVWQNQNIGRFRNSASIKFVDDGKGGVLVEYYEFDGANVKNPPQVVSQTTDELLLKTHNGEIKMKREGSLISAEWLRPGVSTYKASFQKSQ
jgi:hypothetical protein